MAFKINSLNPYTPLVEAVNTIKTGSNSVLNIHYYIDNNNYTNKFIPVSAITTDIENATKQWQHFLTDLYSNNYFFKGNLSVKFVETTVKSKADLMFSFKNIETNFEITRSSITYNNNIEWGASDLITSHPILNTTLYAIGRFFGLEDISGDSIMNPKIIDRQFNIYHNLETDNGIISKFVLHRYASLTQHVKVIYGQLNSTTAIVYGCTNAERENYNPLANLSDNSCGDFISTPPEPFTAEPERLFKNYFTILNNKEDFPSYYSVENNKLSHKGNLETSLNTATAVSFLSLNGELQKIHSVLKKNTSIVYEENNVVKYKSIDYSSNGMSCKTEDVVYGEMDLYNSTTTSYNSYIYPIASSLKIKESTIVLNGVLDLDNVIGQDLVENTDGTVGRIGEFVSTSLKDTYYYSKVKVLSLSPYQDSYTVHNNILNQEMFTKNISANSSTDDQIVRGDNNSTSFSLSDYKFFGKNSLSSTGLTNIGGKKWLKTSQSFEGEDYYSEDFKIEIVGDSNNALLTTDIDGYAVNKNNSFVNYSYAAINNLPFIISSFLREGSSVRVADSELVESCRNLNKIDLGVGKKLVLIGLRHGFLLTFMDNITGELLSGSYYNNQGLELYIPAGDDSLLGYNSDVNFKEGGFLLELAAMSSNDNFLYTTAINPNNGEQHIVIYDLTSLETDSILTAAKSILNPLSGKITDIKLEEDGSINMYAQGASEYINIKNANSQYSVNSLLYDSYSCVKSLPLSLNVKNVSNVHNLLKITSDGVIGLNSSNSEKFDDFYEGMWEDSKMYRALNLIPQVDKDSIKSSVINHLDFSVLKELNTVVNLNDSKEFSIIVENSKTLIYDKENKLVSTLDGEYVAALDFIDESKRHYKIITRENKNLHVYILKLNISKTHLYVKSTNYITTSLVYTIEMFEGAEQFVGVGVIENEKINSYTVKYSYYIDNQVTVKDLNVTSSLQVPVALVTKTYTISDTNIDFSNNIFRVVKNLISFTYKINSVCYLALINVSRNNIKTMSLQQVKNNAYIDSLEFVDSIGLFVAKKNNLSNSTIENLGLYKFSVDNGIEKVSQYVDAYEIPNNTITKVFNLNNEIRLTTSLSGKQNTLARVINSANYNDTVYSDLNSTVEEEDFNTENIQRDNVSSFRSAAGTCPKNYSNGCNCDITDSGGITSACISPWDYIQSSHPNLRCARNSNSGTGSHYQTNDGLEFFKPNASTRGGSSGRKTTHVDNCGKAHADGTVTNNGGATTDLAFLYTGGRPGTYQNGTGTIDTSCHHCDCVTGHVPENCLVSSALCVTYGCSDIGGYQTHNHCNGYGAESSYYESVLGINPGDPGYPNQDDHTLCVHLNDDSSCQCDGNGGSEPIPSENVLMKNCTVCSGVGFLPGLNEFTDLDYYINQDVYESILQENQGTPQTGGHPCTCDQFRRQYVGEDIVSELVAAYGVCNCAGQTSTELHGEYCNCSGNSTDESKACYDAEGNVICSERQKQYYHDVNGNGLVSSANLIRFCPSSPEVAETHSNGNLVYILAETYQGEFEDCDEILDACQQCGADEFVATYFPEQGYYKWDGMLLCSPEGSFCSSTDTLTELDQESCCDGFEYDCATEDCVAQGLAASKDCLGVCGGTAVTTDCGCDTPAAIEGYDCNGDCLSDVDCNGNCGGVAVEDACGLCNGDGSSCANISIDVTQLLNSLDTTGKPVSFNGETVCVLNKDTQVDNYKPQAYYVSESVGADSLNYFVEDNRYLTEKCQVITKEDSILELNNSDHNAEVLYGTTFLRGDGTLSEYNNITDGSGNSSLTALFSNVPNTVTTPTKTVKFYFRIEGKLIEGITIEDVFGVYLGNAILDVSAGEGIGNNIVSTLPGENIPKLKINNEFEYINYPVYTVTMSLSEDNTIQEILTGIDFENYFSVEEETPDESEPENTNVNVCTSGCSDYNYTIGTDTFVNEYGYLLNGQQQFAISNGITITATDPNDTSFNPATYTFIPIDCAACPPVCPDGLQGVCTDLDSLYPQFLGDCQEVDNSLCIYPEPEPDPIGYCSLVGYEETFVVPAEDLDLYVADNSLCVTLIVEDPIEDPEDNTDTDQDTDDDTTDDTDDDNTDDYVDDTDNTDGDSPVVSGPTEFTISLEYNGEVNVDFVVYTAAGNLVALTNRRTKKKGIKTTAMYNISTEEKCIGFIPIGFNYNNDWLKVKLSIMKSSTVIHSLIFGHDPAGSYNGSVIINSSNEHACVEGCLDSTINTTRCTIESPKSVNEFSDFTVEIFSEANPSESFVDSYFILHNLTTGEKLIEIPDISAGVTITEKFILNDTASLAIETKSNNMLVYNMYDEAGNSIKSKTVYNNSHFEPITISLVEPGCTNSEAGNYNPSAKLDDGSCIEAALYNCVKDALFNIDLLNKDVSEETKTLMMYTIYESYKESLKENNEVKKEMYRNKLIDLCDCKTC